MPNFLASDGTRLACRVTEGDGDPVVCLPGGPMQDSAYLDDLGGLSAHRRLAFLDLRGTGRSAIPEDPSSYRCDRQVDDVEALRQELGLDRMDVLGHSAGANLATLYAARHPDRIGKLALIAPSAIAVGVVTTGQTRREIAQLRRDEPWFPAAFAALERITNDQGGESDWAAIDPFFYGRWDAAAKDHRAEADRQTNLAAAKVFASDGAFSPETSRAAISRLDAPVLLLAGEFDLNSPPRSVTEFAGVFRAATLVVQPGAGHFPWLDDARLFAATVSAFLV